MYEIVQAEMERELAERGLTADGDSFSRGFGRMIASPHKSLRKIAKQIVTPYNSEDMLVSLHKVQVIQHLLPLHSEKGRHMFACNGGGWPPHARREFV
jgi:hypothetical protein